MTRIGLYAASFDPITNGHLWVIEEGAALFDDLVISVAHNYEKKGYFKPELKLSLVQEAVKHLPNVKVVFGGNQEYTANLAARYGAGYMLRGLRNSVDFEYEKNLDHINSKIGPSLRTIYVIPPASQELISSSMVKGLVGPRGWMEIVKEMVPGCVFREILTTEVKKVIPVDLTIRTDMVVQRYSEPHRHYHTMEHVFHCADELRQYEQDVAGNNREVELALWLHDLVYDPTKIDNEEQSAEVANAWKLSDVVCNAILATKHHKPTNDIEKLVCDIDLSILGQTPDVYSRYAENIRKEYKFVPWEEYKKARVKFMLSRFLEADRIYHTKYFYDKYQTQAVKNIEAEIVNLLEAEIVNLLQKKEG